LDRFIFRFFIWQGLESVDEGMDDEDLSQLWLRYAAGESWGLIARSFFVFFYSLGFFFVCRFRCSWPGDVMVDAAFDLPMGRGEAR